MGIVAYIYIVLNNPKTFSFVSAWLGYLTMDFLQVFLFQKNYFMTS